MKRNHEGNYEPAQYYFDVAEGSVFAEGTEFCGFYLKDIDHEKVTLTFTDVDCDREFCPIYTFVFNKVPYDVLAKCYRQRMAQDEAMAKSLETPEPEIDLSLLFDKKYL